MGITENQYACPPRDGISVHDTGDYPDGTRVLGEIRFRARSRPLSKDCPRRTIPVCDVKAWRSFAGMIPVRRRPAGARRRTCASSTRRKRNPAPARLLRHTLASLRNPAIRRGPDHFAALCRRTVARTTFQDAPHESGTHRRLAGTATFLAASLPHASRRRLNSPFCVVLLSDPPS
jgi:hypothetical protein